MTDIKSVVAYNIAELRQANAMTQLELGERLNYSDKAVSKWERADSMPDISVLVEIADLFGVTLDYLVREEHTQSEIKAADKNFAKRLSITTLSVLLVWFLAVAVFVFVSTVFKDVKSEWLVFIYAVPASAVVCLVFNSLWFNPRLNFFIISILMWTVLTSVYLTLLTLGHNIWMVYLLGIPCQVIIILLSLIKRNW